MKDVEHAGDGKHKNGTLIPISITITPDTVRSPTRTSSSPADARCPHAFPSRAYIFYPDHRPRPVPSPQATTRGLSTREPPASPAGRKSSVPSAAVRADGAAAATAGEGPNQTKTFTLTITALHDRIGIVTIDESGNIRSVNPFMSKLFGCAARICTHGRSESAPFGIGRSSCRRQQMGVEAERECSSLHL